MLIKDNQTNSYGVAIVGGGPAGITAAIYCRRAGILPCVFDSGSSSLQKAEKIENFYGISPPVSGKQLYETGLKQAKDLAIPLVSGQVTGIEQTADGFELHTPDAAYIASAVILACGSSRKTPKISGLTEYEGLGVSYCAMCDGFFFRGKNICVLGSGEYALAEARYLQPLAGSVKILTNASPVEADFSGFELISLPVERLLGGERLERVVFSDGSETDTDGVFIALGTAGAAQLSNSLGARSENGYVFTHPDMSTDVPGLYACGDCAGTPLQIAKAVYEGMTAANSAVSFVKSKK